MFREKTEYLVCPIRLMDIYAEVKLVGGGRDWPTDVKL